MQRRSAAASRPAMISDRPAETIATRHTNSLNHNSLRMNRSALSFWVITLIALASSATSTQINSGRIAPKTNALQLQSGSACAVPLQLRLRGGKGKGKDVPDAYSEFEAPKRPLSAYMLFAQAERPKIVESQPTLKMTEISGVIGERWKKLKPEEKTKFEQQAQLLKKKYEKSKAEYESKVPEDVRKERQTKKGAKSRSLKPKKDPNAPKKPHSAFMIYSISAREKVREADPKLSFGDVGRKIAEQWNAKTPAEKKVYEEKAVVLKEKYIAEKAKYDANKATDEPEEAPVAQAKVTKAKAKKEKTK